MMIRTKKDADHQLRTDTSPQSLKPVLDAKRGSCVFCIGELRPVWSVTRMSRHRNFAHDDFGSYGRAGSVRLLLGEDRQIFRR